MVTGGNTAQLAILLSLRDEASRAFKTAGANAQTFGNTLRAVGTIAAGFLASNVVGAGLDKFSGFVGSSIKSASDLGESVNAVQQVFRESSDTILKWGEDNATAFGLSQRAFNQLATPLGAILKNLGFNVKEAGDQTIELTKRAADMASVFNTDVSDALDAINSALRGEGNPIERYGVSVNETTVNLRALAMTGKTSAAQLTQHEKAVARLAIIYSQTNDVAGDFQRTSGQLANSQRIAAAEVEKLQGQIGTKLLPVMLKITQIKLAFVKVVANQLLPALERAGAAIAAVAGPFERWAPIVAGVAAVLGGALLGALVAIAAAAWAALAPLLLMAAPFIAIGAAIGLAVAALVFVIQKFDSLPAPVRAVLGVLRTLALILAAITFGPLILAIQAVMFAFQSWDQIVGWVSAVFEAVKGTLASVVSTIASIFVPAMGSVITVVQSVLTAFQSWDQITGFVAQVFGAISNTMAGFVNWVSEAWGSLPPILTAPFAAMISPVKSAMTTVMQLVQQAISAIGNQLSKLGNIEIMGVKPFAKLGELGSALSSKVGDVFSGIDATFDGIAESVNSGISKVGGAFSGIGAAAAGMVAPLSSAGTALGDVATAAGSAVDKLRDVIERLEDELISRQVQAFFKGGIDAVNAVRNMQVGIREQITKLAAQLMQVFGFDLPTALGFAMDEVLKKADELPNAAKRVVALGRTPTLGFAQGGVVPGPIGWPVPAIVHGGEKIFRADQEPGGKTVVVNNYIYGSLHSDRTLEDAVGRAMQQLRRRNVQV